MSAKRQRLNARKVAILCILVSTFSPMVSATKSNHPLVYLDVSTSSALLDNGSLELARLDGILCDAFAKRLDAEPLCANEIEGVAESLGGLNGLTTVRSDSLFERLSDIEVVVSVQVERGQHGLIFVFQVEEALYVDSGHVQRGQLLYRYRSLGVPVQSNAWEQRLERGIDAVAGYLIEAVLPVPPAPTAMDGR